MAFKSYLKDSYRLHVSTSLRCPDHCSLFALSDPSEPEFFEECDHSHDLVCNDCEGLYLLESLMKNAFSDPEVVFTATTKKKINSTMCKFLWSQSMPGNVICYGRYTRTEQDKKSWIKSIQAKLFAMKLLPRCFKETQMEWFGKRGISWHISHCVRRTSSNECEVSRYSHLIRQSLSQNSEVVAAIMRHTLQEEKARHPEIKEAFYRSDCAGLYASGGLLVPYGTSVG